jgi:gliding motility-associated-like protein
MKKCLILTALTLTLSSAFSQVPNYVPTSGLVGWWPFNGNANDASGNGFDGTAINGALLTSDRYGISSRAYSFDGVNDFIQANISQLNKASISLFYFSEYPISDYPNLFRFGNIEFLAMAGIHPAYLTNNNVGHLGGYPDGLNSLPFIPSFQNWHHVVMIHDNDLGLHQIWINGTLINQGPTSTYLQPSSTAIYIGNTPSGTSADGTAGFKGKIDDIGVWNRALTQCEITDLYNASLHVLNVSAGADQTVCSGTAVTLAGSGASSYSWDNGVTNNTPFTPTASTTYTVTGTDANTCTATDQVVLQVTELPTVTESINDICPGAPVTLTASSPLSNKTPCVSEDLPLSLQSGLVGYWPFCGNANDESGNGNNGAVNGATLTTDRFGNADNAYSFDGDDWISLGDPDELELSQDFTISCWFNSATNGTFNTFLSKASCNEPNIQGYVLGLQDFPTSGANPKVHFQSYPYMSDATPLLPGSNGIVSPNSWKNFSVVYNKTLQILKYYVDGNEIFSINVSLTISNTTLQAFIGRHINQNGGGCGSGYFNGKIDDISIWNRILSAAEISANFNIGNPSYSWSTGETTSNIAVNPSATASYSCDVTVNGQTCSDEVTINVIPNSSSTISPTVCDTYTAPDGAVYTSSGTHTAIIPNAAGCDSTITINLTVNNSTSSTISPTVCNTYTAPDGTVYTSSGTHTAVIPNAAGCDSTITINLTVNNSTSSTISSTVCDTYTAPDGTVYTTSGTHTAVIPNAIGCDSTITINLTVNDSPTLNAGSDQLVCEGTEVTLTASGAATYSWTNGIVNGTPFTPAVGTLNYNVTGTDANGCQGSDNVLVTVTTSPILTLTSSSPECPGEATGTAEAVATGGTIPYTFLWNNGSVSPLNNEIPAGTYSVILTDNAGCSESGIVVVTDATEPCFFIPGGLSPNADGNNDSWAVSGLSAYPDAKVMVYNRWGQLLYDAGPDGAPWDGTYLSEELPTADYYYIIDLGNGETFNGVITLKR